MLIVPAGEVLKRIAEILDDEPVPVPPNLQAFGQHVDLDSAVFKLDIKRGETIVCTVRVFLMKTALYMVEFQRGQV